MNPLTEPRWSPYVVGVLLGVLSWITFATMDKALGASTAWAVYSKKGADHV